MSALIMLITGVDLLASLSSDQLLAWTIFGPLLIFVIIGQHMVDQGNLIDYKRYRLNNLKLSAAMFFIWTLADLAFFILNVNIPLMMNVAGGLAAGYLALMAYNRVLIV